MRYLLIKFLIVASIFLANHQTTYAQKNLESQISDSLTAIVNSYTYVGKIKLTSFSYNTKSASLQVVCPEKVSYMPFRTENVARIYNAIRSILGEKFANYRITCVVDNTLIESLVPNFYLKNPDLSKQFNVQQPVAPLLTRSSQPFDITNGLINRHIAVWQSHGRYFNIQKERWVWQRPRLLETVEDLFTQSFVLPYLVPMLENAGANVLIPRERDTQLHEIIVDNDSVCESRYRERNDRKSWKNTDEPGFANPFKFYLQSQNPFAMGTCRMIPSISDEDEISTAEWFPNFPEAGKYAVYISYKTLENSVPDAHYSVYHSGIKTDFVVNQQMNGGTWLYLGHFYFNKGRNNQNKVVLTNFSAIDGKTITADATKFGGGMGNMARSQTVSSPSSILLSPDSLVIFSDPVKSLLNKTPEISNYPRYTEGARYWLQWAGVPDSVYSRTQGKNDYLDDFQSRGFWVNYLAGGSSVSPNRKGLNVPIDLALAIHSDAGSTPNDSIIGTLGICSVPNTAGKTVFENGVSRWASRDLTDIVMTQVVGDIRKQFAPEWARRGLWNKSYSESRVPEVPTMLLELLSHQNFADMRYGLDPRFRFTVGRSIYKGILKYLSTIQKTEYVVQPLPVEQFSCRFVDKNKLELHWKAVKDTLEPTATAEKYVLYTRVDDNDFDDGVLVSSNRITSTIQSGKIYSFKVSAINKGGQSFPSEILSACRVSGEKGIVLMVNGFDRLSAPVSSTSDSTSAGFYNDKDPGVPYLSNYSFVGDQFDFRRKSTWVSDEAPGFGASHSDYETTEIAGNTFDYPHLHGKAIKSAGYSFVSSSLKSVLQSDIDLNQYKIVDLILGEQKQTFIGNTKKAAEFKTFPLALQLSIQSYCAGGGNLLVSGAYVASDVSPDKLSTKNDGFFLENTLKIKLKTTLPKAKGIVKIIASPCKQFKPGEVTFYAEPNSISYYVNSVDAIEPVGDNSFIFCNFSESNFGAGVAYSGKYKSCTFGFPFEAIKSEKDRAKIMESILQFFAQKKVEIKK